MSIVEQREDQGAVQLVSHVDFLAARVHVVSVNHHSRVTPDLAGEIIDQKYLNIRMLQPLKTAQISGLNESDYRP